jgi:Universal stress protein family
MIFERIVCGVDGSPAGFEALRQAATVRVPDGRLIAAIVSEASLPTQPGAASAESEATLRAEAQKTQEPGHSRGDQSHYPVWVPRPRFTALT